MSPLPPPRVLVFGAGLAFFLVMWVGGVVSYTWLGGPPADARWTAPSFLALAALLVLVTAPARRRLPLLLAAAGGFGFEVLGVATGFPFGSYQYTETLAPSVLGVPLALGAAWLVLVAQARELLAHLPGSRWLRVLAGSVWMTAFDLVIDPLAAGPLDYWRWAEAGAYHGIPATNFLGWLAVSTALLALQPDGPRDHPWAERLGLAVLLFFTALAGVLGLALPAVIGLGLLGGGIWLEKVGGRWAIQQEPTRGQS
jgi:uncharacterized membrane protein